MKISFEVNGDDMSYASLQIGNVVISSADSIFENEIKEFIEIWFKESPIIAKQALKKYLVFLQNKKIKDALLEMEKFNTKIEETKTTISAHKEILSDHLKQIDNDFNSELEF